MDLPSASGTAPQTAVPPAIETVAESATPHRWSARVRTALSGTWVGPIAVIVGTLLLIVAGTLPVWGTRLIAPQYPKGLDLWFYGGRVSGPVTEVNGLNHYIGMQPIDLARVPELQLWPLAIVASAAVLAVGVLWKGWLGRLALLALWLVPVVVLVDIQRWLMIFGTELDPASALRLDPFVPFVVGPSQVWNFTVWTYPGLALILVWLVALLATVIRRCAGPPAIPRLAVLTVAVALAVVGTVLLVVPSAMSGATATSSTGARGDVAAMPAGREDLAALVGATPDGGTLVVPPGRYRTNLVIDRPMTLVAGGDVLLDGGGRGTVVTITADDVALRGFRIAHTGGQVEEAAGIKVVRAARTSLEDNTITDFYTGIASSEAVELRIVGNTLMGSGQVTHDAGHATNGSATPAREPDQGGAAAGATDPHAGHGTGGGPDRQGDAISLWATSGVLVRDNILHAVRDGLYLNYVDRVLVDSNEIHHSRYAVHSMFGTGQVIFGNDIRENLSGLVLMYTADVQAGRNAIADQRSAGTGFGVVLKDVAGLHLVENVIVRNRTGLRAEGTVGTPDAPVEILRNRFASNQAALSLAASSDLGFGANVFTDNLIDLHSLEPGVERRNDWTYQGTGNTWSSYRGYDLDGDGVGDVPHTAGGAQQVLLSTAPALEAFLTTPAMQVLDAAQELWEADRPAVIRDTAPRLAEHAPTAIDDRSEPQVGPWVIIGALLVGSATALTVGPRSRTGRRVTGEA